MMRWLRCPALLLAFVPVHRVAAQSTTSLLPDATVLHRGGFAVRVLTGWQRFDELIGNGGSRNLAASFNADSLTGAQISGIGQTQTLLQQATGISSLRVSAGQITAAANSRIVTAPLIMQLGLTRRLTLGLVIPLVETRTTLGAAVNRRPASANIGLNPARVNSDWTANAAVVGGLRSAAATLQGRITSCQATPSANGCAAVLAQGPSLISSTTTFASIIEQLYGTGNASTANPGTAFVPVAGSAAQAAVDARMNTLRSSFQALGTTVAGGSLTAANVMANADFNALLRSVGYDTLQSPDRSGVGDVSIGATFQLSNTFPNTFPNVDSLVALVGFHQRSAINATMRVGLGEPASRSRLFDNATGYGQPGLTLGAATDLAFGNRWALSGVGSYTKQFGSVAVSRLANTAGRILPLTAALGGTYSAGDVASVTILPRIRVAGYFSVNGVYAMTHIGGDTYTNPATTSVVLNTSAVTNAALPPFGNAAATLQQAGFGVSYSTIMTNAGPGHIPFEVSLRHVETLSASGGPAPKTFEDQISLSVYFR